jgi:hypothetical protein
MGSKYQKKWTLSKMPTVFYEISQNLPKSKLNLGFCIDKIRNTRVHISTQIIKQYELLTFPSQIKDLIDGRNVQNRALHW